MSATSILAASLFAALLYLAARLVRGVPAWGGATIHRRDDPARFWAYALPSSAFFGLLVGALLHDDPLFSRIVMAIMGLILIAHLTALFVRALRRGRISETTRAAHPAAFWSAAFGILLLIAMLVAALWIVLQA